MLALFQGAAAVGIRGIDSVVLAVEKRTTAKLQVWPSITTVSTAFILTEALSRIACLIRAAVADRIPERSVKWLSLTWT